MYNSIGHLTDYMEEIFRECIRVTVSNGNIYVISSFKMDKMAGVKLTSPSKNCEKEAFEYIQDFVEYNKKFPQIQKLRFPEQWD